MRRCFFFVGSPQYCFDVSGMEIFVNAIPEENDIMHCVHCKEHCQRYVIIAQISHVIGI